MNAEDKGIVDAVANASSIRWIASLSNHTLTHMLPVFTEMEYTDRARLFSVLRSEKSCTSGRVLKSRKTEVSSKGFFFWKRVLYMNRRMGRVLKEIQTTLSRKMMTGIQGEDGRALTTCPDSTTLYHLSVFDRGTCALQSQG
jgi:hypothetical protein